MAGQNNAAPSVASANAAVLDELPFANRQDFVDAERGFVGTIPDAEIRNEAGRAVWSMSDYDFLKSDAVPATVNPSLWRQSQLNCRHGLFEVVPGIYQIRGFDISNMTLIEGKTGVIVIDPLVSVEPARAGLELYFKHRGKKPVAAVIYTHSHTDHWGGVKGVVSAEDVASGKVPVIAPEGFVEAIAQENVLAGTAMVRRAQYQFGPLLPKGASGQVDAGLGKTLSSGAVTLIAPTDLISRDFETRTVDGVEIVFLMAPDSEAPAEMHMYYPALNCLNMAENSVHNFHNLLPFRGAEVRDSRAWSRYIDVALANFGDKAAVLIGQHHWPVWERDNIKTYLSKQRDLYKYVHDQTLRLANHGHTPNEIAELIELPKSLAHEWALRGYYGTVRHNAKAIYQKYLGWYDGNPAHLDPLPPADAAKKFVEYAGGFDAALAKAKADFARGEFRWVAEAANHLVFADPSNVEARALAAATYEQLGYLAEAATWRNSYLFAAHELRHGAAKAGRSGVAPDALAALPLDVFFDLWAVRLNGPKADGKRAVLNWVFTDTDQVFVLNLENSALTQRSGARAAHADATLTLTRKTLNEIMMQQTTFPEAVGAGKIKVEGNGAKLLELLSLFDAFTPAFAIVEP
ncbi:MAG TPA: alkyl sulfatase dimerization domain-containing protein [Nitrobacter sp.]|nr:alkyl sulfatase dimerization domain-containing protein [Nitrobacter sp.]